MIRKMPSCGGCRTCELACSFHHRKVFNPALSSLKVKECRDGDGYEIELLEKDGDSDLACDGCRGLETPLCLLHCREREELNRILDEFAAQKEND